MSHLKRVAQSSSRRRAYGGAILAVCVALLLVGVVVYALRHQLLTSLGEALIVDEQVQPADIIFLLNGDADSRPFYAAELFNQGLAPQIVIAKAESSPVVELGLLPNETLVSIDVMEEFGVPAEDIVLLPIEGGVTSTRDEAVVLRQYVDDHAVGSVILVTSAFHTRRARRICEKELAGSPATLQVSAAPHWGFDHTNWWRDERGLIGFANEVIKSFYYLAKYR